MKKMISILALLLCAALVLPAAAIETGAYDWQGYTITLTEIQENPGFAPASMTPDQRAIAILLEIPEDITQDDALKKAFYAALVLMDENDEIYRHDVVLSKGNIRTCLYAVPKDTDTAQLRLVFEGEGDAAAQPLTLKDFMGRWSPEDQQFIFRDAITWESTTADIRALLGEQNIGVSEKDGVSTVFGRGNIPLEQGEIGDHAAMFRKDQLALISFEMKDDTLDEAELYDKIVSGLTELYGAPNAEDFSLFSGFLATYFTDFPELMPELEEAPWKAWLLPDQNTLVFTVGFQGNGVVFINLGVPTAE